MKIELDTKTGILIVNGEKCIFESAKHDTNYVEVGLGVPMTENEIVIKYKNFPQSTTGEKR